MTIREKQEQWEKEYFSPYATLSVDSRGRSKEEPQCDIRPVFQRDRDRIIHSKSFRRLKHKTQVFLAPLGDHYRTRLTHTLEVSQNARTIARALRMNESLVEAIALGHDLGHTPFGHAGERTLNSLCEGGFNHANQSVRVVELLEKKGEGLNLTWETRDGIMNHGTARMPHTLEGKIVRFSDKIAYINHDIDDAIRGGIISNASIPDTCVRVLGTNHSSRIDTMVRDVIENSLDKPHVSMSDKIHEAMIELRSYMFDAVYIGSEAKLEEKKAGDMIASLFSFFKEHFEVLSEDSSLDDLERERKILDYIAGMTDTYATHVYKNNFIPKGWYR